MVVAHRNKMATRVQAAFRSRSSWRGVVKPLLLKHSIRKFWNPASQAYYYFSVRTGRVSEVVRGVAWCGVACVVLARRGVVWRGVPCCEGRAVQRIGEVER
jgi:hypothetical protein